MSAKRIIETQMNQYNYLNEASSFFTNHRLHALVLTGLAVLFMNLSNTIPSHERTRFEQFVYARYEFVVIFSFMSSMLVVMMTTVAELSLLKFTSEPMIRSTYDFLNDEFEFEFTAVPLLLLLSVISLIKATTMFALLKHRLLKKATKYQAALIVSSTATLLCRSVSYVNTSLGSSQDLVSRTYKIGQMLLENSSVSIEKPLKMIACFSAGLSVSLIAKSLIRSPFVNEFKNKQMTDSTTEKTENEQQ